MIVHEGPVYYHPELNRFIQVRGITDDYYECGGLSEYYSDATTNIYLVRYSYEFMRGAVEVKAIDKMYDYGIRLVGNTWKVGGD